MEALARSITRTIQKRFNVRHYRPETKLHVLYYQMINWLEAKHSATSSRRY